MDFGKILGSRNQSSPFISLMIGLMTGVAAFIGLRQFSENRADVLAQVDGVAFRQISLSTPLQSKLQSLENQKQQSLSDAVQNWIDMTVLSKEASGRGLTAETLLKNEVVPQISATPEDAYRRYVASPAAEKQLSYEAALQDILADLRETQFQKLKRKYVDSLQSRHSIKNFLASRPGFVPPSNSAAAGRYPIHVVAAAKPELDAQGNVVSQPFLGPKDAKVVLQVFSDFMCPFSSKFAATTNAIAQKYPDKVRIEYRHNPLPFHKGSDQIAEASVCAQEQGKFWAFHDALFANQGSKSAEQLIELARSLGLDVDKFTQCTTSRKYQAYVVKDQQEGAKMGAQGTPSWFINGRFRSGAYPVEGVSPLVDWLLDPKGAIPAPPGHTPPPPAGKGAAQTGGNYAFKDEDLRSSPSIGPSSAPVTWVEFIDYKCGYCKKAVHAVDALQQQFKDKVRLISKNYPLNDSTKPMAAAALCANDQKKFWEYRKALFDMEAMPTDADLKKMAKDLRLNEKTFGACVDSKKYAQAVDKDQALGTSAGVQGTPSYFINGRRIQGFDPEAMKKLLEEEIAGAGKKKG